VLLKERGDRKLVLLKVGCEVRREDLLVFEGCAYEDRRRMYVQRG